ncbi:Abhydrolase-2 domain-containing protein [Mycena indigotica]|uniref:Abhydrolase-2 domain-containing protein n=1 Tax=Mycena indigotica TaxID=2126181 RepID=A0A8H6S6G2_9AGAR|nr:Abhydrolase-2 domain-containing protein [Mycena indigotica]KAF7292961.1 Abhydrolase-2 domain-containing protein [Mycena indigotica]
MPDLHIHDVDDQNAQLPRIKPPPRKAKISVPFSYAASDDGTDENLLILLHGLGDTQIPFFKLGKQLKLPQTAVLVLQAPERIPFLYEEAYAWYPSFDPLGELIPRPNPTSALELLDKIINHLREDCTWPLDRVHLFGFAQGGSVAAEFGVKLHRETLGSIVTVSGPLLSYPTLSTLSLTPILVAYRSPSLPASELPAFKKGFSRVRESKMVPEGGMPASRTEWEPIMRFWSDNLCRRQVEGVYEVLSGTSG